MNSGSSDEVHRIPRCDGQLVAMVSTLQPRAGNPIPPASEHVTGTPGSCQPDGEIIIADRDHAGVRNMESSANEREKSQSRSGAERRETASMNADG